MNKLFYKTLKAGLLVGTLDISAAFIQYYIKTGKNPTNVLRFIASALFGKEAYTGGNRMIVYGLLLHFLIAYIFTLFFFLIFPKIAPHQQNRILIAVLYGPFMWALMQYAVLPLTAAPKLTVTVTSASIAILILIVCIAMPLSFMAANYYKKRL